MQQHFSAHLTQAHSNHKKNATADTCVRQRKRKIARPPWRTNLYIHPSQMQLVGIEFEAKEGSSSYTEAGTIDITKISTARISETDGNRSIKASNSCVLHYHCKKTCPVPMRDCNVQRAEASRVWLSPFLFCFDLLGQSDFLPSTAPPFLKVRCERSAHWALKKEEA